MGSTSPPEHLIGSVEASENPPSSQQGLNCMAKRNLDLHGPIMQIRLDMSMVGHVPGCLAGLWHVVALCLVSPGFSSLHQKRTTLC